MRYFFSFGAIYETNSTIRTNSKEEKKNKFRTLMNLFLKYKEK